MIAITDNIWAQEDFMELGSVPLHLRMTVIKLANEKLWLHSPTAISPQLQEEVDSLGKIAYIVAPNNAHNLWLQQWQRAYPHAEIYVSKGIPKKLPKLSRYKIIEEQPKLPWSEEIEHLSMPSVDFFDEQVFFHSASSTLIVTDLVQHHLNPPVKGLKANITQWVLKKIGFKDICTAVPLKVKFLIKDKPAFKVLSSLS